MAPASCSSRSSEKRGGTPDPRSAWRRCRSRRPSRSKSSFRWRPDMTDAQRAQDKSPDKGAGIRDRIRGLEDGSITPPATRDASTVVLLRDGVNGLEAYLLRRASTMSFGPGMHVFPGG